MSIDAEDEVLLRVQMYKSIAKLCNTVNFILMFVAVPLVIGLIVLILGTIGFVTTDV